MLARAGSRPSERACRKRTAIEDSAVEDSASQSTASQDTASQDTGSAIGERAIFAGGSTDAM